MTKRVVTDKGVAMTEISAKEFGKLQSDVAYLKETSDRHTSLLEKMDTKLDGLVTHEQLNKTIEPIEVRLNNHSDRIAQLEQRNTLSDASVWKKIGIAFEGNFIKFIGLSLFIFALVVGYLFIRQDLINNAVPVEVIDKIQAK